MLVILDGTLQMLRLLHTFPHFLVCRFCWAFVEMLFFCLSKGTFLLTSNGTVSSCLDWAPIPCFLSEDRLVVIFYTGFCQFVGFQRAVMRGL